MENMKRRKAQVLWQEFPFLWSILQEWSGIQDIKINRLDSAVLRQIMKPQEHRVFLCRTGTLNVDNTLIPDYWRENLIERSPKEELALIDILYPLPVLFRGPRSKTWTNAVIIHQPPLHIHSRLTRSNEDEDIITVYKPPRLQSIDELVQQEVSALRDARALPVASG